MITKLKRRIYQATIGRALEYWRQGGGRRVSPGVRERRQYHVHHLVEIVGDKRLAAVTSDDVRTVQSQMLDRGYAVDYVNLVTHCTLRAAFRDLEVESGRVFIDAKPLRGGQSIRTDAWTAEQANLIVETCSRVLRREYSAFVRFAMYTGARLSELQGLQWRDVDFSSRTVAIERSRGDDGTVSPCKTEQSRRILRLPTEALDALRQIPVGGPRTWVFVTPRRGSLWWCTPSDANLPESTMAASDGHPRWPGSSTASTLLSAHARVEHAREYGCDVAPGRFMVGEFAGHGRYQVPEVPKAAGSGRDQSSARVERKGWGA